MSVASTLLGYGAALLSAPATRPAGAAALVAGLLSMTGQSGPPKKGEPGFVRYMAAVHIGLLLPLLYAAGFLWRAYEARADAPRLATHAALAGLSLTTFGWLCLLKPKKSKSADKKQQ